MKKPKHEILTGDHKLLDHLASQQQRYPIDDHPLQETIEEIILTLSPSEQEVYYLRFGEGMSIRQIAIRLGYSSHQVIQVKLDRIKQKVKEHIEHL